MPSAGCSTRSWTMSSTRSSERGGARSHGGARPGRNDLGQSTVEFVLLLPFVLLALLAIVQVAIVMRDQAELDGIARDAALSAARSPNHEISQAVRGRLATVRFRVQVENGMIVVDARRTLAAVLPPFGIWLDSRPLTARAASLSE